MVLVVGTLGSGAHGEDDRPIAVGAPIRAVSFNVRYGTADDGENRWELRRDDVVRTIRSHGPDLLGLQEALPFQVEYLAARLPAHERYAVSRTGDAGETCAIFWRRDRFELVESETFWLAPTPDEPEARGWDAALPRICSWVRLRDRVSGVVFVFANTHFDHRGREARERSAELLAERFARGSQGSKGRVVLAGDFNAPEGSAPVETLVNGGFVDTFRARHPRSDGRRDLHGFRGRSAPGQDRLRLRPRRRRGPRRAHRSSAVRGPLALRPPPGHGRDRLARGLTAEPDAGNILTSRPTGGVSHV